MPKSLALIIQSLESPPSLITKQLEARDFSVHLGRSLDEAERVFWLFQPTKSSSCSLILRFAKARAGAVFSIGYGVRHQKQRSFVITPSTPVLYVTCSVMLAIRLAMLNLLIPSEHL